MSTLSHNALPNRTTAAVNTGAKDTLARLMASENLTVVHNPAAITAMFATDTRVLTLPVYNGSMTNEMYDMFVGHEVGHALFTPAEEKTVIGALDSIDPNNHAVVHDYMNVVEDARIERLMKAKYPGLGRVFTAGYKQFIDSDFFGIKGSKTPIAQMSFIDRLNIHIKGGLYCGMQIPFSAEEQVLVDAVAKTKTFDDVTDVAREIYDFVTQPKQDQQQQQNGNNPSAGNSNDQGDADQQADGAGDGQNADQSEQSGSSSNADTNDKGTPTKNDGASKQSMDKAEQGAGQDASLGNGQKQQAPASQTQQSMKDKMQSMRDKNAVAPSYFRIPTVNLDNVIVDYKRVHNDICAMIPDSTTTRYNGAKMLKQFNDNSREYISTLVREFERKMAADEARRTFVSKTGTLDMSRIHTYMFNEDLFLKNTTVAQGKNHGMVMFIDWSGSMGSTLENTMYQMMNLILFCNALRIPYEVYAFSSIAHPDMEKKFDYRNCVGGDYYRISAEMAASICKEYKVINHGTGSNQYQQYTLDTGDYLSLGMFSLINLCSSRMNKKEMRTALENLMYLAKNHSTGHIPGYLGLGGTPLDECVVAAMQVVPAFREATKAQIVNTVFLTDGASGSYPFRADKMSNQNGKNIIICRSASGATYTMDQNQDSTSFLRTILRAETRSTVTGFFLTHNSGFVFYDFITDTKKRKEAEQSFNDNFFATVTDKRFGYDAYYIIDSKIKSSTNKDVVQGVNAADTFQRTMQRKKSTRMLLTQFAGQIAQDFKF